MGQSLPVTRKSKLIPAIPGEAMFFAGEHLQEW